MKHTKTAAAKTLLLSLNNGFVQMQVLLPLFMQFLLMISGSRKVTVKRKIWKQSISKTKRKIEKRN